MPAAVPVGETPGRRVGDQPGERMLPGAWLRTGARGIQGHAAYRTDRHQPPGPVWITGPGG